MGGEIAVRNLPPLSRQRNITVPFQPLVTGHNAQTRHFCYHAPHFSAVMKEVENATPIQF